MAYREVTMLEVKEVLRLWLGGAPKKRISAQLGLNVKTVRRYLEKVRVPLFVWALVDPPSRPDLTRWGAVEDIRTVARLRKAFRALEENLESQRIVWIDGKHLPQEIVLSEKAVGIELVD